MDRAAELRALAERMAKSGGRRIIVTERSAELAAYALNACADLISRPADEHPPFTVDVWNDGALGIIETMARCSSLLVARAAFEQAVKERGRYEVTLRHGIRTIDRYRPSRATS